MRDIRFAANAALPIVRVRAEMIGAFDIANVLGRQVNLKKPAEVREC
jgi:hypothetical protein